MFADHNEQNLGEETGTGEHKQMFMFRTVSMIIVFVVLLVSSQAFEFVQRKRGKGKVSDNIKLNSYITTWGVSF